MPRKRVLAIVALLYVIEGLPSAVFNDVLPVRFRVAGMDLVAIGWLAALGGAWTLKALWSPLVDRFGSDRGWIVGCGLALAGSIALVASHPGDALDPLLVAAVLVLCVASATQDIAIDAYTIRLVPRGGEGLANAVRVSAYRIALMVGGGALLFLPRPFGWPATLATAAALFFALALAALAVPGVPRSVARPSPLSALTDLGTRPQAFAALGFVLLYRLGDLAMAPMIKPFWVDRGLSPEEIGLVSTTLGALATMAGAAVGGVHVERHGLARGLVVCGIAAIVSNLGYAVAAIDGGRPAVYAASITESFCSGLASAAFLGFLMRVCDRERAAVQYACLSALYALPRLVVGPIAGATTEVAGYAAWFAGTALLGLPALTLLSAAKRWIDLAAIEQEASA